MISNNWLYSIIRKKYSPQIDITLCPCTLSFHCQTTKKTAHCCASRPVRLHHTMRCILSLFWSFFTCNEEIKLQVLLQKIINSCRPCRSCRPCSNWQQENLRTRQSIIEIDICTKRNWRRLKVSTHPRFSSKRMHINQYSFFPCASNWASVSDGGFC